MRPRRGFGIAPDEGPVGSFQVPVATVVRKGVGEATMRCVGLGDDHDAAGILVETVHDTGPFHPANA